MTTESTDRSGRKTRRDSIRRLSLEELKNCVTISIEEAANLLGVSRSTAYEAARNGTIRTIVIGKRRRVLATQLYALLTGRVVDGGA
jgi:excisionase family DNA binding protein